MKPGKWISIVKKMFRSYLPLFCLIVTINQLFSVINVCFEMVPDLQCHVIRYRSNWSNKGEVSGGTNEPAKCLKSKCFLKSFALIIRRDDTFICNIKTIMTFWVNTIFFYFVYIVIRYWRPNCNCKKIARSLHSRFFGVSSAFINLNMDFGRSKTRKFNKLTHQS